MNRANIKNQRKFNSPVCSSNRTNRYTRLAREVPKQKAPVEGYSTGAFVVPDKGEPKGFLSPILTLSRQGVEVDYGDDTIIPNGFPPVILGEGCALWKPHTLDLSFPERGLRLLHSSGAVREN
jgi:hypothetical protein